MTTKPPSPRLLAEQIIGVDNLGKLDKAGIGIFSRAGLRERQNYFREIQAQNQALFGIVGDALVELPFRQRLRLVHRALAIPGVMPCHTHKNVVRRRFRRVVGAKRFPAHSQHPTSLVGGADAERPESGPIQVHHRDDASALRQEASVAAIPVEQTGASSFWSRLRMIRLATPRKSSNLPADLLEFALRSVRELKRQHPDAGV